MISTDVFTITNPALGGLILWSFLQGYESNEKEGCPFPLIFLPLPLILSKTIRDEFKGTNAGTGLYTWVAKNPKVLVNLKIRIESSSQVTRNAIVFASASQVLKISEDGVLFSNNSGIAKNKIKDSSDEINEMVRIANRFGKWLSQINSVSDIYNSLVLRL